MELRQLEYSVISKISDVSTGVYRIFKIQWDEDRKAYNKIKYIKDNIMRDKESVTRYIVGGDELRPERGIQLLEAFKTHADVIITHVDYYRKAELAKLKETADMLITYIKLAEHEPSAWNQFK